MSSFFYIQTFFIKIFWHFLILCIWLINLRIHFLLNQEKTGVFLHIAISHILKRFHLCYFAFNAKPISNMIYWSSWIPAIKYSKSNDSKILKFHVPIIWFRIHNLMILNPDDGAVPVTAAPSLPATSWHMVQLIRSLPKAQTICLTSCPYAHSHVRKVLAYPIRSCCWLPSNADSSFFYSTKHISYVCVSKTASLVPAVKSRLTTGI